MAARIHRGITRRELAEQIGITTEDVLAFERGETDPRLSELRRYAKAANALTQWEVISPERAQQNPNDPA